MTMDITLRIADEADLLVPLIDAAHRTLAGRMKDGGLILYDGDVHLAGRPGRQVRNPRRAGGTSRSRPSFTATRSTG